MTITCDEFITWLQQFPKETEIQVMESFTHGYGIDVRVTDIDIGTDGNTDYIGPTKDIPAPWLILGN